MEQRKLIETLRATLDPNQRHQAEEQLSQIHKIIGFAPSLLQVIMMPDVDMPVRQAGAVYLKNLINSNWADKEVEPGTPLPFTIHEQDRAMIRDAIVDAVVHAPELIKAQLCVCVNTIVKHDFPGRWTQIVDKISIYLQNPEPSGWTGALLCLYQLVKNFEYKKAEERAPLNEAMNLLFPMIYQLIVRLLPDQSEQSVLLQKQILKIYFALTQYVLPLDLISREVFSQWMEIVRSVADRPVPDQTNQIDEEERPDMPWWKCKKWALHILHRMFERYGSPGSVTKDYKEFSEWYLKTFSGGILECLLKILDQYRRKTYVSPRVLQQTLNYINIGVSHAHSWKFLKPHMFAVIQEVLFPLMSYSDADDELWNSDPHDYIRVKFDIFEGFVSPVAAAQTLLHSACKKRKDMLQKTMQFILQVLTAPNADAKQKDGVLHMVGSVAEILLKKQMYKDQMDSMIQQYVFPEFRSPHGHMRARACWVLHHFSEINFKQEQILTEAVCLIVNALLTDGELPVKVEAAIALQMTLSNQERSHKYVEPQVKPVTLELLKIIRETENDDLTNVMQLVVMTYTDQLKTIAVEMCQHLAQTFSQVLDSDEGSDEKAIMAMGLLNTIETLLSVMEEQPEIIAQLQPTVLGVIGHIFTNSVMDFPIKGAHGDHRVLSYTEFYEEALSLVYDLTSKTISPEMWKVFELMYQIFEKDGFDYFTDMMPALHNYVTVDTEAFLANPQYVEAMYKMAKAVLTGDAGEDPESHAAKLLEVIILQCKGRIDQCIGPFVELVLQRLLREVKTSELRTMCLQVVISALYYNPQLLFSIIDTINLPLPQGQCASTNFIKQWLNDTDCFLGLHDRKLCVLGMCTLISMTPQRPCAINECVLQIIPSLIVLFDGLKRAYAEKAQEQEEEDEEDDDEIEEEVLSSDEDELNEDDAEYIEKLQEKVKSKKIIAPFDISSVTIEDEVSDDDSDDDYVPLEETALESYTTPLDEENCPIDEYVAFKEVLQSLQGADQAWYNALTAHLTAEQQKALHDIMVLADQRKAAAESKRIEQSGGYAFVQHTVPTSFNFGGTPLGR